MGIDTVRLVFSLLYALTHLARSRSPAWRGQQAQSGLTGVQAQPCLFSHFLCFDAFGKKPQSGLARTTGTTPLVFSPLLCLNPFGVTQPAGKRRSVQEPRRHARRHPFRKDGARTPHD